MSIKKYGIYLAYPPTVDLRAEGLGRHLAEFLKAAQERGDVHFAIACPSWMRMNLLELLEASGVRTDSFEIIAPSRKPLLLSAHQRYGAFRNRPKRKGRLGVLLEQLGKLSSKITTYITTYAERRLVSTRSIIVLMVTLGLVMFPFVAIRMVVQAITKPLVLGYYTLARKVQSLLGQHPAINKYLARINDLIAQPKQDSLVTRLYRLMEEAEASLMRELIDARKDIVAWYSPTAFWPHFNEISAPHLTCVPDVVLADFPIGFASVGGNRFLDNFRQVEKAINGGEYFVTYSEDVKWRTLVERYHVDPAAISVVPHGANRLDELVVVSGFPDNEAATNTLCRNLFGAALWKNTYASIFGSSEVRFIFYASQFRPNKNIISLLKAYEYLLKRRYFGYKLALTGDPNVLPEVAKFVAEHNLKSDVLCLYGLSEQELAACYRLADLAVNPSLSEGGCPFTFTEALSVGTPVVMARIPVTEEVITSPDLQELMLFDPYDWKDMANRIEWGLKNQHLLLEKQKPFYEQLAQRTWRNVVDEYVAILDRISIAQKADQ